MAQSTNCIRGVGISDPSDFPTNPKYFTQTTITELVTVPTVKPDIELIVSVMVEPEIMSMKVIDTPCIKSYEGQVLSGKKLLIELKLKQKITYIADVITQTVHSADFDKIARSIFVIVPPTINNIPIEKLVKSDKLQVTTYIEDICAEAVDARTISKCVTVFIDVVANC